MEIIPIKVMIFGFIPEAILMVWAGLFLSGVKPQIKKVIIVGILQGITSYFIRQYLDFGTNTLLSIFTLITYTYLVMKVKCIVAIISIVVSWVIVMLIEGSLIIFMDVNIIHIWSTDWMRLLFLLPHEMVLGFIVYIGYKKDISLLNEFEWLNKRV